MSDGGVVEAIVEVSSSHAMNKKAVAAPTLIETSACRAAVMSRYKKGARYKRWGGKIAPLISSSVLIGLHYGFI